MVLILANCTTIPTPTPLHFVIPDEPTYGKVMAMPVDGGVCFDDEAEQALMENFYKLKFYADEMRDLLKYLQRR